MPYFRVQAARGNEKLEFLIRADSLDAASDEVHKGGYTILSINEQEEDLSNTKQLFYFDAVIKTPQGQSQKKSGKIQSSDAIQAYKTLVEKYHCVVERIYTDALSSDDDKVLTTARVAEAYRIYQATQNQSQKTATDPGANVSKNTLSTQANISPDISPLIQKELNLYRGLIDTVLFKIENLLSHHTDVLSAEKKATLNLLYTTLRQTKNITNVAKLKQVGETALKKIGELEVEVIRKKGGAEKQEYIQQTNQLLKQFGSHVTIGAGDKDLSKKTERLFRGLLNEIKDFFILLRPEVQKEGKASDGSSTRNVDYGYYHQLQRLELYKEKLQINKNILRTISDAAEKEKIQSKIRLIEQNIALINARVSGKKVSYAHIVKGSMYYEDVFVHISHEISRAIGVSILFFTLCFFLALIGGYTHLSIRLDLALSGVVSIAILALLLRFVRGRWSFVLVLSMSVVAWLMIHINTSLG